MIDTADVYSTGRAEEIVGEVLEGRRDDFLVATKVCMSMGDGANMQGLSRHHIVEGCEASLRRLRTDHIDLYQVHEWDGLAPLEETLGALQHLVDSEQLTDNLGAAELELGTDELARLEQVSRPRLIYPYWHQLATSAERFSAADLALQAPYLKS